MDLDRDDDGPGGAFRDAREAANVTVDEVAQTLNLSVRVVNGLESNRYEDLPGPAFTRGYIRAYAKLLELDGDELVELFDQATLDLYVDDVVLPRQTQSIRMIPQQHPGRVLGGIVTLIVLGAAAILWWIWPEDGFPGFTRDETRVVTPVETELRAGGGAGHPAGNSTNAAVGDDVTTVEGALATMLPSDGAERVVSGQRATDVQDGAAAGAARDVTGGDRLIFSFAQDSWVEVEDRDGATLHADLGRAGDSITVTGRAPFTIILGNAPATTLQFNGNAIALGPHTRNRIANLVLGQ